MVNFVTTLSKQSVDLLRCASRIQNYFDDVMKTFFIREGQVKEYKDGGRWFGAFEHVIDR